MVKDTDIDINYSKLVDKAMHAIVFKVLKSVEQNGLSGEHHFFISFSTIHPEVKIAPELLEKYPKEMTIVLQYQFKDLKVTEHGFSVSLSFNGVMECIEIPFIAMLTFADPSVQFGLQFRGSLEEYHDAEALEETEELPEEDNIVSFEHFKKNNKPNRCSAK